MAAVRYNMSELKRGVNNEDRKFNYSGLTINYSALEKFFFFFLFSREDLERKFSLKLFVISS